MQEIFDFFGFAGKEVALFLVSMIPIVELRGSIILGAAMNMNWLTVFLISFIGNILPIPLVILFGKKILKWLERIPCLRKLSTWYQEKLLKKAHKVTKYSLIGLCLFVAIPLPGTGAWSGAAIAALLDLKIKQAYPVIVLGVFIAGVIMTLASYGVAGIFQMFS